MKKRLLSAFLAVMMVLTMAPVAFAADDVVAKIGDATYSTLADAVVHAKTGDTIVMTAATDISKTGLGIASDKDITLDLNGYEVKAANTGAGNIKVYGKLTLKDSTDTSANGEGQGKITTVTKTYIRNQADQPIIYAVNGDFVMQSGLIDTATGITNNSNDGQFGVGVQNETANASVTIEGGKIKAGWYAVSGNGQMINHDGNITVNGGILESTTDYAIYNPQKGTTTINGGVIYGQAGGIAINRGTLVVNDGMITSKGIGNTGSWGDGTGGLNNAAIHANANYGDVTVSVKGGKVIAEGDAVTIDKGTAHTATVAISGGTFSSDISKYCEKNYYTEQNEDNTYTVKSLKDVAVAQVGDTYYKTLAEAIAAAKDGGTIDLLSNVSERLWIRNNEDVTINLNGHTISSEKQTANVRHGKLTVNGPGTIKEDEPYFGALLIKGSTNQSDTDYAVATINKNVTLEGWAPVFIDQFGDKENTGKAYGITVNLNGAVLNGKKDSTGDLGSGIYVNGNIKDATNAPVINLDSTTVTSEGQGMYLAGYATTTVNGGSVSGSETGIEIRAGKLTVNGATVTGNGIPTSVTPNGNGSTSVGAGIAVAQHTTELPIDVTISDGMISGYTGLLESNPQNNPEASIARVNINVTGGKFAAINGGKNAVSSDDKRVIISGGVFAQKFDNSYCATGMTVIDNKDTTYKYTVGTVKVKDENDITTATKAGTTTATLSSGIDKKDETDATAVGKSVTPTKLTDTTPITPDDKAQALTELVKNNKVKLDPDGKIQKGTTVTVVKETYLDVTVTAYDTKSNTVSMNIAPKYNLIAVAKTGTNQAEQIVLKSAQDAKVGSTEVEVTLPDAFKGKKVYINHNNGANLYVATADKITGKVKFTTNGFSPFTFALTNPDVVAEVNGNAYKTLQDAADAAKNGDEITVVQNKYLDLAFNTTKSVKVTNKTNDKITVKFNGTNKEIAKDKTETFSYTKPSSSGGSSSGKTTFKVVTSSVNNGGVNASPSSADKGAVITITLSPDKGYKLDKLTVTDGSGKTIATTKKSDTVYTFTMPASQVKVGVTYVKADTAVTPSTGFNDVASGDWFADAVKYVVDKGMMNGTGTNTFAPKANTTRGMIVTVLYRLENEPNTSAASFTDVAAGQYYNNAVAWANANGIVTGYGNSKFGPNDKITREQLAAILYRYAQYKKYDVSASANLSSYVDAQSVSSYATSAAEWACGAGVVTGKTGSKLDPKGSATRAEVAAMLMRFCENVAK